VLSEYISLQITVGPLLTFLVVCGARIKLKAGWCVVGRRLSTLIFKGMRISVGLYVTNEIRIFDRFCSIRSVT
jgi:hypothetical protein